MVKPLPIPPHFKDALDALRKNHDNIRTLLCRAPGSEGPGWAIDEFDVLRDLFDSETRGKEGREFKLAKKKVKNIINNHVFKYVQTKYMLDKNNQVVEIGHSEQTNIVPRSTNQTNIVPRSTNQTAHGPQPLPSWNPNPNPFMMLPGGMIPIPINVQTGPVNYGPVNYGTINHHHEGASEEKIEKINKNLTGIREEQMKQGKEIGDLKSSHTKLQTTVHSTLKKKPKPSSNDTLCDGTPTKLFGNFSSAGSSSFRSPLAGEPCREDTVTSNEVTNIQRALRDLTIGSTNGTVIERFDRDAGKQPIPEENCQGNEENATASFDEDTTTGFDEDASARFNENAKVAGEQPIPEETCQGNKENNATATTSKNRRVIRVRPDIPDNPNWKQIVLFGESAAKAKELRSQSWDFLHLKPTLEQLHAEQPEKDLYLFQGPPFLFKHVGEEGTAQADTCPTLAIVIVPRGETPPEFVVMYNPKEMTETVIPFEDFGVEWKSFQPRKFGENVYALKQKLGVLNTLDLGLTKLWTLPEDKLRRKDNGTNVLDVTKAVFEFRKPDGGIIREWYDKEMSTFTNICLMHDLVLKDENGKPILDEYDEKKADPEQLQALKRSIKCAFEAVRTEREDQIHMLNQNHPSFATNSVVKVFPQNKVVLDYFRDCACAREAVYDFFNPKGEIVSFFTAEKQQELDSESPFTKVGYISEWYGTAGAMVPDPNEARN